MKSKEEVNIVGNSKELREEDYCLYKDVIGFEDYKLNRQGVLISKNRISLHSNGKKCTVKERKLKPQLDNTGYIVFGLRNREKQTKKVYLHRILCELFIPNPDNKPCVNHKDGVKLNNSLHNLEWCTYKENNNHAFEKKLNTTIGSRLKGKTGEKCHNYGKRNKKVYSNTKEYINIKEASKDLNLTKGYLYQCLCGSVPNIHNLSYNPITKPKVLLLNC